MSYSYIYPSPVGELTITASETGITGIAFEKAKSRIEDDVPDFILQCVEQLQEYFNSDRQTFTVPLEIQGNEFHLSVWQALLKIPYGKTVSYLDIAKSIGNPKAVRAVGSANNRNKIPIIIPCHRVIGRDGSLVGYAGGIWRKEYLLKLEKALLT